MRRRIWQGRTGIVCGLLAVAVLACGESPLDLREGGLYVLTRVNGVPLPATLVADQHVNLRLESDTLRFLEARRFERVRWISAQPAGSDAVTLEREVWTGTVVAVSAGYVLVDDVCGDPRTLALCVAPDTVRATAGGIVLRGPVPPAGSKRFELR